MAEPATDLTAADLPLARGGDEEAFRRLVEPLQGDLRAHLPAR